MRFLVSYAQSHNLTQMTSTGLLIAHGSGDSQVQAEYSLHVWDAEGRFHRIGHVKLGHVGLEQGRPDLPEEFTELGDRFFSLGQGEAYYQTVNRLGSLGNEILKALRDVALDIERFTRLQREPSMIELLRHLDEQRVAGRYHRLATGDSSVWSFAFVFHGMLDVNREPLRFAVSPTSTPPTNVHAIVGSNGTGKTTILNGIVRAIVDTGDPQGGLVSHIVGRAATAFAHLVVVSFNAFDRFHPLALERRIGSKSRTLVHYIGMKRPPRRAPSWSSDETEWRAGSPKSPKALCDEFVESVRSCFETDDKTNRWTEGMSILHHDALLAAADLVRLATSTPSHRGIRKAFDQLSSGHKIVLLAMTRLVDLVEEHTLVLFDEPEAHLHPPLLATFVQALSRLLAKRNGMAIVATHSPVIVQELPRNCVWKLRRTGGDVQVERPQIETFGENVSVLTNELFGLEVTQTGFHKLIRAQVERGGTYEEVLNRFNTKLGSEARALVRGLIELRSANEDL